MLAMDFTMKNEFENKREIGFQWQGKKAMKANKFESAITEFLILNVRCRMFL